MIKIITLLSVFIIFTLGAFWLAQNSGSLTFDVLGYHIETSFVFALTILIIFFFSLLILLRLVVTLIYLPRSVKNLVSSYYKIDLAAQLEEILLALNRHDHPKAKKVLTLLKKYKLPENLINILASEVAMLKEDVVEIKSTLLTLTKYEPTRIPGLEGLVSLAIKEGNLSEAINYSEELSRIHQSEWLLSIMINIYMQSERWQDLVNFLQHTKIASLLNKEQKHQLYSIAKYKLAYNAFLSQDYEIALQFAIDSYKAFADFSPTLALLARLSLQRASSDEAIKYLKQAWKLNPCFSLTDIVAAISENYPKDKALSIAKNIASYNPKHYESHLIIARAALDTGKYEEASSSISAALEGNPKFRACLIMAEYCQKTHGNIAETIDWLKRAINSELDLNHCLYFWDLDIMAISKNPSPNCLTIARV